MGNSKIEWTDETWNPVTGCTKISPGCAHCYAQRMTKRLKGMGKPKYAAGFDKVVCHPDELDKPLHWRKPRRVFVNSMGDLFHEDVPFGFILSVFHRMVVTPRHTYQVLTKRPERVAAMAHNLPWPENIQLGTSVENQAAVKRIPHLVRCPAAVRFLSLEPLLGEVVITDRCASTNDGLRCTKRIGHHGRHYALRPTAGWGRTEEPRLTGIGWVIVGGESGPGARPMDPDWVRSIRNQCQEAGVALYVKQICDSKGRRIAFREWPNDLQIREMPGGQ